MNSDQLQGKWKQVKGSFKQQFGKLTDDDFAVLDGQRDQLIGKVQERYGIAKDAAEKRVDDWATSVLHESDEAARRKSMREAEEARRKAS